MAGQLSVEYCPPGPALDAAVARLLGHEVLGMVACQRGDCGGYYVIPFDGRVGAHAAKRPVYLRDCMCEFREDEDADYFGHIAGCLRVIDSYSGGIVPALELKADCRAFTLSYFGTAELEVCWYAKFLSGDYVGDAYGSTAPLAICRAFLLAHGVEFVEVEEMK